MGLQNLIYTSSIKPLLDFSASYTEPSLSPVNAQDANCVTQLRGQ